MILRIKLMALCLLGSLFTAVMSSCEKPNAADALEEVRLDDRFSNADIVRNPMTAQQNQDSAAVAQIQFQNVNLEFGEVIEGTVVLHKFKFKNIGTNPLFIKEVRTTCGCTATEFPKQAILPNTGGEILVRFDTQNKTGQQRKTITVFSNAFPSETQLSLLGSVTKSETLSDKVLEL